jgi:hypothetical protein
VDTRGSVAGGWAGLGHTVLDQAGTGRWAQPNSIEDLNFFSSRLDFVK